MAKRTERQRPELWGPGELCAALEVSRATLQRWRALEDFPQPLAQLEIGDVWDAAAVRQWAERTGRPRG